MNFSKKSAACLSLLVIFCLVTAFSASAVGPEEAKAVSAALYNVGHDTFLYGKDMDMRVNPASTTKVMTMLVVIDAAERGELSLEDTFAAYDDLYYNVPSDGSTAKIQPGEILSVRDYLYCAMIVSANEACNALAVYKSGSVEAFVAEMNAMAEKIGCMGTHFANTNGITHENHYVTARDMALILNEAIKHPDFMEIAACRYYYVPATEKYAERHLNTTNRLLRESSDQYYKYAVLGKTGTTDAAGNCIVALAEKDGQQLIAVIMGAEDYLTAEKVRVIESFTEAKKLFEWGFDEYNDWRLVDSSSPYKTYDTLYAMEDKELTLVPKEDFTVFCSREELNDRYATETVTTVKNGAAKAPVFAGMRFGTVTVLRDGEKCAVIPLVAAEEIRFDGRAFLADLMTNGRLYIYAAAGVFVLVLAIVIAVAVRKKKSAEKEEEKEPAMK